MPALWPFYTGDVYDLEGTEVHLAPSHGGEVLAGGREGGQHPLHPRQGHLGDKIMTLTTCCIVS